MGRNTHLHADSYHSAFYGDLLIVSFEVVKTGGVERAGDDAEDVRYFPLDDLPPLAFRSNQRAVDACVGLHRDQWRIQDSFHAVQHEHDVPLLSTPVVRVIEEHSADIAQAWFDEMLTSPTTLCYRHLDPEEMRDTARTALSRLDAWMRGDAAAECVFRPKSISENAPCRSPRTPLPIRPYGRCRSAKTLPCRSVFGAWAESVIGMDVLSRG